MASFLYSKQLTTKNRMVEVNKGGATRVTVVFPTEEREIYYFGRSRIPVKDIRKILLHAYGINFIIFNVMNDLEMFDEEHLKCGDVVYVEEDDNSHSYLVSSGPGKPKPEEKLKPKEKKKQPVEDLFKGYGKDHLPSKRLEEKMAAFQAGIRAERERRAQEEEEIEREKPKAKGLESPGRVYAKRRRSEELVEWDLENKLATTESQSTLGSKQQSESTATLASKADYDPVMTIPVREAKHQDLKSGTFSDFSFMPLSLASQHKKEGAESQGNMEKHESSNLVPIMDVNEDEEEKTSTKVDLI